MEKYSEVPDAFKKIWRKQYTEFLKFEPNLTYEEFLREKMDTDLNT